MVKKCSFPLLVILLFSYISSAQDIEIKSLQTYAGNNQTNVPIIVSYDNESYYLNIEFDIAANSEPNLNIVFRFCDRNWMPVNNVFLSNTGRNIARNLSFNLLPSNIEGARYHYKGTFPDEDQYVDFPFSGKWRYYITESYDTSIVYAAGKFIVVNDSLNLSTALKKEELQDDFNLPQDMSKVFNISVKFELENGLYPSNVQGVEIIENHKLDYPYTISREENTSNHAFYWDGGNKFHFFTREIRPGNEYRETDLRDPNLFNSNEVNAQLSGIETSRRYFNEKRDLNGGSILLNYKNDYAEYLRVNFKLRPANMAGSRVFLVGAFNNWAVLPDYELTNRDGLFTGSFNLKRGIYDYQYVTANNDGGILSGIDWYSIEGNSWNTNNIYYIFLYYSEPQKGGYDRIIGYQKIMSE